MQIPGIMASISNVLMAPFSKGLVNVMDPEIVQWERMRHIADPFLQIGMVCTLDFTL